MPLIKLQSEGLNLADNFAFTGTISGAGESNTPYFRATGTTFSPSNNTWTKMQMGSTTFTVGSTYDTSNYRWTPNVAGYYYCYGVIRWYTNPGAANELKQDNAAIYKNGSAIFEDLGADRRDGSYPYATGCKAQTIVYLNGSSDYVELYGRMNSTGQCNVDGGNCQFTGFLIKT